MQNISPDLEIIWLASYPKSGNTWLRFFLTCLIHGKVESSLKVEEAIPEIGSGQNDAAYSSTGKTIIKSHCTYQTLNEFHPHTKGIIYIMRNPLDVMLSGYNYHCLHLGTELDIPEQRYRIRYFRQYLRDGGDEQWMDLGYGTWYNHLTSWLTHGTGKHPFLLIRYEDMLSTPYLIAEAINSFLQLNKSPEEIQNALAFASFKNMKAMEERELQEDKDSFFKREQVGLGYNMGKRFMNQGKANQKHTLPPGIRTQAQRIYGSVMRQFGYL